MRRSSFCDISPSDLGRQGRHVADPISQRILTGWVQEESLLSHCPVLWNILPLPGGEAGPHPPGLLERSEDLALWPRVGTPEKHAAVGLVSTPKALPSPFN